MKKILSMVGVGAIVLTLSMGYSFAQQATPQQTGTAAVSAESKTGVIENVEKGNLPAQKPATEVKVEKAASKAAPVEKEKEKATATKSLVDKKGNEPTVAKPLKDKAVEKAPAAKGAAEMKGAADFTDKNAAPAKTVQDKATDTKGVKAVEKTDETKPAAKQ